MPTSGAESDPLLRKPNCSSPPRWHHILYLLVAFALFTVSLSLVLSHRYVQIYVRSVTDNQAWTQRLHECSRLGQLAAGVNAPGNDVFQSHQVAAEEAKMQAAMRLLEDHLDAFQGELRANADGAEAGALLEGLNEFRQLMRQMAAEAHGLFTHLRSDQTTEAGEGMAAMDRQYARANRVLERLRGEIAAVQERHFEHQTAVAASLLRFQYVM